PAAMRRGTPALHGSLTIIVLTPLTTFSASVRPASIKYLTLLGYLTARLRPSVMLYVRLQNRSFVRRGFRAPGQQAILDHRQQPFGDQRYHRDHDHGGEHAVGIERALCGGDQQPQALARPKKFADYAADQCEAEADMEARKDPRPRGRNHHRAGHLP